MKSFRTEIEISAQAETVWTVLTQKMPVNPELYGIIRLEGTIAPGAQLKLWSEAAPKTAFSLSVASMDPPKEMVWKGGMPLGLFVGTRVFSLETIQTGCKFTMQEDFTGLLSGLITRSMPDLTPSFTKFAHTLKSEAEK
ncbi:MAG: SRPBCC domain-containing protein [Pseudomonadota bacterium]